jgi:hypothetical protein
MVMLMIDSHNEPETVNREALLKMWPHFPEPLPRESVGFVAGRGERRWPNFVLLTNACSGEIPWR